MVVDINYPDITDDKQSDQTHLPVLGNELILNTLSGAIYAFLNSSVKIFPVQNGIATEV